MTTTELPPADPIELPPVVDQPPGRPTTRAGRQAAAAANKAAKSAARDKAPKTPRVPVSSSDVAGTVKGLHDLAGGLALPLAGYPLTGKALREGGAEAGKVWAALAKRYPAVEKLFSTGGDGVLIMALVSAYLPVITTAMGESKLPKEDRKAAGLASMDPELLGALMGMMGGGAGFAADEMAAAA